MEKILADETDANIALIIEEENSSFNNTLHRLQYTKSGVVPTPELIESMKLYGTDCPQKDGSTYISKDPEEGESVFDQPFCLVLKTLETYDMWGYNIEGKNGVANNTCQEFIDDLIRGEGEANHELKILCEGLVPNNSTVRVMIHSYVG